MKKHKFLLPLAALAASFTANEAIANTQFIVNVDNATKSNPDNIAINNTNQFNFILQTADSQTVMAYHRSHRSHYSHRSHRSHYSGR
jgi:hypothetical protein